MTTASKTTWTIDPTHSELTFKVKHLMITNVKGEFRKFDATIISQGNDFTNAELSVEIDASSIDTNNNDRDAHLRGADFFDVANNPKLTFKASSMNKLDENNFQLRGLLGIRGVEKEILLDVDFGGFVTDPYGNQKAGFSINGKFSRKEWGLTWNATIESGGLMVSDEVRINAEVQFIKQ